MTSVAELVYGRRAVREALRGRREVLEVLATERAARDGWERKPKIVPERALTELAGTRDHQGVVARVEPFRYADAYELAAGEPLLVALDQVTDPRNLGAVIRSAEGAGATGVIVPAHNSARVTPAVARSSAGAVEHLPVAVVPNLARYLNEVKGPRLWIYAGPAGNQTNAGRQGSDPRIRRGGKDPTAVKLSISVSIRCPAVGVSVRSLRGAAPRGERRRGGAWARSASSTAQPALRRRLRRFGNSSTGWRASSREAAHAASSSSRRGTGGMSAGRCRCDTRRTRTRC